MKIKQLLMLTTLIASPYLWAHTTLEDSVPHNGAILNEVPKNIVLRFTQPTKLVKFELLSPKNQAIETAFKPTLQGHQEYVIKFDKPLTSGLHTVFWTLIGSDGHKVEGDLQFTVESLSD